MPLYNIFVVNTAPGCDNSVVQQISADTCTNYIVRLASNSNALGPFDVYLSENPVGLSGATLLYSAQTRTDMFNGVVVQVGPCATPTPTPTPSAQTPTPTPTNTETPSQTPTLTPTTTITASPSQTPTFTPTESATPTFTPTPSITQTQTPTFTPTPSTTPPPDDFDIELLLQDGEQLLLQDGNPILAEQPSTPFLVSSGDTFCDTNPVSLTQTIYASSNVWSTVVRFYSDSQLTTPFNGGGLNYTNESGGCGPCVIIDNDGFSIFIGNPC